MEEEEEGESQDQKIKGDQEANDDETNE